ncbi:hypothetical protein QNI16_38315 [Cytophagaceae bacterium YF14B1]|uniref:Uncharacterized protein n=1 Tax=Xanthocytophaga flava TaxID=3048013 RepID=A0AAE3QWN6_9BACT|nr:hypothetical protein [Xanthocytophaga flavus]MDJ1486396.1 hypothetical protein [Xanthocytophaga flavus]
MEEIWSTGRDSDKLAIKARSKLERKSTPSRVGIDNQSVKITQFIHEEKGIDGANELTADPIRLLLKQHYLLRALHRLAVDSLLPIY